MTVLPPVETFAREPNGPGIYCFYGYPKPFVGHIFLSSGKTAFWSKKLFPGGGILHLCIRK